MASSLWKRCKPLCTGQVNRSAATALSAENEAGARPGRWFPRLPWKFGHRNAKPLLVRSIGLD
jgi:hypothetical protein